MIYHWDEKELSTVEAGPSVSALLVASDWLPEYQLVPIAWRHLANRRDSGLELSVASPQPLFQLQRGFEFPVLAQCTFPHDGDSPSSFHQTALVASIPLDVGLELGAPEVLSGGWSGRVPAPGVPVPEASVDEAHSSQSPENQIGSAGKRAVVQAVPQATSMESPTKDELGRGVPAPNPRHHA